MPRRGGEMPRKGSGLAVHRSRKGSKQAVDGQWTGQPKAVRSHGKAVRCQGKAVRCQ